MVVFRAVSYLLVSIAFVFIVLDGIRSLAAESIVLTPLGQIWFNLHSSSINLVQPSLEARGLGFLWDPVLVFILQGPAFLTPAVLALFLAWIGRKRQAERKWIGEVE